MQNQYGKSALDMDANLVALLCYLANFVCWLGVILSIITIIQDKTNKLARFHAWQSLLTVIGSIIFTIVGYVVILLVFFIGTMIGVFIDSAIGFPIVTLVISILSMIGYILILVLLLAGTVGSIIAAVKGYNGEIFKLPIIGKFADKLSN